MCQKYPETKKRYVNIIQSKQHINLTDHILNYDCFTNVVSWIVEQLKSKLLDSTNVLSHKRQPKYYSSTYCTVLYVV